MVWNANYNTLTRAEKLKRDRPPLSSFSLPHDFFASMEPSRICFCYFSSLSRSSQCKLYHEPDMRLMACFFILELRTSMVGETQVLKILQDRQMFLNVPNIFTKIYETGIILMHFPICNQSPMAFVFNLKRQLKVR